MASAELIKPLFFDLEKEMIGLTDEQLIQTANEIVRNSHQRRAVLDGFGLGELNHLYTDDGSLIGGENYNPAYGLALWGLVQQRRLSEQRDLGREEIASMYLTGQRVTRAFRDFYFCKSAEDGNDFLDITENDRGKGEFRKFAFLIQSRSKVVDKQTRMVEAEREGRDIRKHSLLGDVSDYLPFLSDLSPELRYELFETLPSFVAADYLDQEGDVIGHVVCAPITIGEISKIRTKYPKNTQSRAMMEIMKWGTVRVKDTLDFLKKKRTNFAGLGAWMGALTKHGEKLPTDGVEATTGHLTTTYAMIESLKVIREKTQVNIAEEAVGIIGCGHIGTNFAMGVCDFPVDQRPQNFVLSDKDISIAERLAEEIRRIIPGATIMVTDDNEIVTKYARVICGSATNEEPCIENLQPGTIFINDSEPPLVVPGVAEKSKAIVFEPLLMSRKNSRADCGIRRVFPREDWELLGEMGRSTEYIYGENGVGSEIGGRYAEWSCGVEVLAVALGIIKPKIGRILNYGEVKACGQVLREFGMEPLPVFRYMGKDVDEEKILRLKKTWEENKMPQFPEGDTPVIRICKTSISQAA